MYLFYKQRFSFWHNAELLHTWKPYYWYLFFYLVRVLNTQKLKIERCSVIKLEGTLRPNFKIKKQNTKNKKNRRVQLNTRSSHRGFSIKKMLLKFSQNWHENTAVPVAQVFFCEFCEIFKNTFFYRTSPVAASGIRALFWPSKFSLIPVLLNSVGISQMLFPYSEETSELINLINPFSPGIFWKIGI